MFTVAQGHNSICNDSSTRHFGWRMLGYGLVLALLGCGRLAAQTSVVTQHNDISRSGANSNETILTPANVNTTLFGKLFSYPVDGWIYAQPLYLPNVTMGAGTPQAGTVHNVVFIATEHDSVYAFDADSNTGANANPLWHVSMIDAAHGAGTGEKTMPNGDISSGDIVPEIGISSTPVIDPTTNTIYVVAKSTVADTTFIQRLHALDITTGLEKFGGPAVLSGSVPGTGNGSSGGTLHWDPKWENNRASLLLLNGIVYLGFGSHGDNGPWHGWILAYNAGTLQQTGVWCATPNAAAGGIWMGGTGLAADVPSGKPYGRVFTATGNGTYDAVAPNYTNAMDFGDSIIKLDLANGVPTMISGTTTVGDDFTPHDQASLNNADEDQASGGVVILPDSVGGGNGAHQLVQLGKSGRIYVLNRENLGGYNSNNATDPEEKAYVNGLWGAPAYWNGNVYVWSVGDNLKQFSFANGAISSTYTAKSTESVGTYSPTPSVSANGTANGVVWSLKTDNYSSGGREILYAHNAANVATLLYSSEQNVGRDNPGNSVKFIVPTVVNGKVYVGSESQVSIYGLLNGATQAATPVITPGSESFNTTVQVSIMEGTSGAAIYYTTDGSVPTTASAQYNGPFTVSTTTTVNAIAAGGGYLASAVATSTLTLITQVAEPTFNPAAGSYTAVQNVTISTSTPSATIYYTTDGTKPSPSTSAKYSGPVAIGATETLSAIATASTLSNSPVASGLYTIDLGGVAAINLGSGFTAGSMNLLGNAKLNGSALELTDGGGSEAAAAWYQVEANIAAFTTDFSFQITPAATNTADGFTFTMQGNNASSIGYTGGGLGYGPDSTTGTPGIASSVAVKFDLYSNAGEGVDSTGLYLNGASPTVPAVDMTSSGVNLHSGDVFHVHMSYDGTTLTMTITDTVTNATFTQGWAVDIPSTVGGNVAYVGFTGGTGGLTAVQQVLNWTFVSTAANGAAATPTFNPPAGTYLGTQMVSINDGTSGATIYYTTDGSMPSTNSTQYISGSPITVSASETINAIATATGYNTSGVGTSAYVIESQVPAPTFNPPAGTYLAAQTVAINDSNGTTAIYYTTNGTAPNTNSTKYTVPITVSASETVQAIATASGYFASNVSSAAYTITPPAATPVISPATGTYPAPQTVTLTDGTTGATIYYTTDGSAPTTSSPKYTAAFAVNSTTTIHAMATAPNYSMSAVAASTVTIAGISYSSGFTSAGLTLNGSAAINGTRLRLTNGTVNEAGSAWSTTPVNVQTFTNDFTFQLTNPNADGFMFVIQNSGATALGSDGGSLGYAKTVTKSVGVKFDLYNNSGEGTNSTGLYLNGAAPTVPAITLGGGVNLHSGDIFKVHMTYDGTTLAMNITDTANTAYSFTNAWTVNIPSTVGASAAYVGFTAGTGGATATQDIVTWSYSNTVTNPPNLPVVYQTAKLTAVSSGPTFRTFTYAGFPDTTGTILDATKVGDNVTFTVNVATAGTYDVKVSYKAYNIRGIWQMAVNGSNAGPAVDEYRATDAYAVADLGNINFPTVGNYSLKFTVTGRNSSSTAYSICWDDLTFTPQ